MPDYVCMIQRGQEAERKQETLAAGLKTLGQRTFGDDPEKTEISWVLIDDGYGFTAGDKSTSSLVVRSVPEGLPMEQREPFMRSICELWIDVTGCSINEIVVTAWDGPLPG